MSPVLAAIKKLCEAKIAEHKTNIELFTASPVGVGEHIDYTGPVMAQLEEMEKYASILEVIEQYF